MNKPRVVVFGYSEVGYVGLEYLLDRQANVVALFTHEDDPRETHWFRNVSQLAEYREIPTFKPISLKDAEWEQRMREELRPDLIFSFYYRHLIPMRLLGLAALGAVNLHGSLLPKYRGKAPVNWAVLRGEDHTGATMHHMVAKADAGDIVDQERVAIGERDTAAEVTQRVVAAARGVLVRQLDSLLQGTAPRRPQNHAEATYFGGRRPEDGRIDWRWPSRQIFNLIRAVTRPYPGAFADMADGRRLVIWWGEPGAGAGSGASAPGEVLGGNPLRIATGDGVLTVTDFEWRKEPL